MFPETMTPVGPALGLAETTVLPASASERTIEYAFLANSSVSVDQTATIRIKDAGGAIVEQFTNLGVTKADGAIGNGGAYAWDRQAPRRLPAGWTITAFASAASVLRISFGGMVKS